MQWSIAAGIGLLFGEVGGELLQSVGPFWAERVGQSRGLRRIAAQMEPACAAAVRRMEVKRARREAPEAVAGGSPRWHLLDEPELFKGGAPAAGAGVGVRAAEEAGVLVARRRAAPHF